MTLHLTQHRTGFDRGFTRITAFDETEDNTGISLGVLKAAAGESLNEPAKTETAWLLMAGIVTVSVEGVTTRLSRTSLFDEGPSCLHVSAGEKVTFAFESDCEFTVYSCSNTRSFNPQLVTADQVANEPRGKGTVANACLRYVRTIFDDTNSDPATELVLGEVVTFPGRWSSYPPHHHPQPEIYHYRFSEPQGYGHAELGDDVYKVKQYDSVKIFDGFDHAQCAAPGYGMYYSWVIRHLPDNRYSIPEFTEEHRWTMEKGATFWQPRVTEEDDR